MNLKSLHEILRSVAEGGRSVDDAADALKHLAFEDIHYAHIDHHRSLRKGFPEVIFGQGKTADQIAGIIERMQPQEDVILATRIDAEKARSVMARFPEANYHSDARMLIVQRREIPVLGKGMIVVVCAGTSDIPVAREACLTAQAMGNTVESVFDVGVSGIHRLLSHKDLLSRASVLVVVAGMEGALPSVVGGLVDRPVIAVPTSVGYGASLGGLTALFAMLNSCSSNVAVVNIDNGFGAGYMASVINRTPEA
ncbi:MAG: nickel pincer cofactor biosynthesis protein LarB [Desulfobacterales bacterium]|nr:nickel pincer cofactor biosynthesis protein LarB [Desulfobacterales bacterium]